MICLSVVVSMGRKKTIGAHWQTRGFATKCSAAHATLARMRSLSPSIDIDAPSSLVWHLIATFDHWADWGVSIRAVDPSTGSVATGLEGRVRTVAGFWIPFEITKVVDGASWEWSVAGIDATGHHVAALETGCRVTFTAPRWAPFYLPVLAGSLRRLDRTTRGHRARP